MKDLNENFIIIEHPDIHGVARGKFFNRSLVDLKKGFKMIEGFHHFLPTGSLYSKISCSDIEYEFSEVFDPLDVKITRTFIRPVNETHLDTREHCRRALESLEQKHGLKIKCGTEFEIYDFSEKVSPTKPVADMKIRSTKLSNGVKIISACYDKFLQHGIEVRSFHEEYSKNQFEIALNYKEGLASADDNYFFREIVKTEFPESSFLTDLSIDGLSNSAHHSISLWKNEENVTEEYYKNWLAGVVQHTPALLARVSHYK